MLNNRDAEDAIKDRDGYNYDGYTLRVEHPRGERGRNNRADSFRDGPGYSRGGRGRGSYAPQRRSDYRILVSGFGLSKFFIKMKYFYDLINVIFHLVCNLFNLTIKMFL